MVGTLNVPQLRKFPKPEFLNGQAGQVQMLLVQCVEKTVFTNFSFEGTRNNTTTTSVGLGSHASVTFHSLEVIRGIGSVASCLVAYAQFLHIGSLPTPLSRSS